MAFTFSIPSFSEDPTTIELDAGSSTFFVGANGSGKTRLAALAEQEWGEKAHRIAAHRSLTLNPSVEKISEQKARNGLRFGSSDIRDGEGPRNRIGSRWRRKAATALLNDFDFLVQTLFAEQSNIALETHIAAHAGKLGELELTNFQKLVEIWGRVLPHLKLEITGDDIYARAGDQKPYSASGMSDGERAVFYMLGQGLAAEPESVLIFDEPELHVHRAILARLWDEVEAARPDCAFLVITHDLEFASFRAGSKFVIRRFHNSGQWEIEAVPENTGFGEEVTTLILGSRKPILFVEGTGSSLDVAIFRACYPDWTVLPRGSCENVVHAVATMRNNKDLTRITCSGIVDGDDYSEADKIQLADLGVSVLPVSEIENLFLLPDVARAILIEEKFRDDEVKQKLDSLYLDVIAEVNRPGAIEEVVLRYCRRRIDRTLKMIDLKDAKNSDELAKNYADRTAELNISAVAKKSRERIESAIKEHNIDALLAHVDNKALLALAAKHLKGTPKVNFESWLMRAVRDPKSDQIASALRKVLPEVKSH